MVWVNYGVPAFLILLIHDMKYDYESAAALPGQLASEHITLRLVLHPLAAAEIRTIIQTLFSIHIGVVSYYQHHWQCK